MSISWMWLSVRPNRPGPNCRQVPKIGNFSDVVAQHFNMRHGMSNFRLGGKVN
jgi:hypothetical protein